MGKCLPPTQQGLLTTLIQMQAEVAIKKGSPLQLLLRHRMFTYENLTVLLASRVFRQ